MGSAQLETPVPDRQIGTETDRVECLAATGTGAASAPSMPLKQQAAERIRAHRERRGRTLFGGEGAAARREPVQASLQGPILKGRPTHHPVAATVAERYANTPSYRAFLAEEAQRAIERSRREAESARAEAEVAARNAQAVAEVQQRLLAELELWNAPQEFTAETAGVAEKVTEPAKQVSTAGLTVRLYEDLGAPTKTPTCGRVADAQPTRVRADMDSEESVALDRESLALDEEILFRQAPVFEPFDVDPPTPLPANLLEFPRQLVAARKVRPRLAEGPLVEGPTRSPQLRIFEVQPEQISTVPAVHAAAPEWANIHLDAQPETKPGQVAPQSARHAAATPPQASTLRPQTAPIGLRAMAAAVDLIMVGFAFTLFAGVTAHFAQHLPGGVQGATAAGATFAALFPLYEVLFFTFSDQTPGMRYARIGLCTLSDENPTRAAIRRRILAQTIALCPLGLGILWALVDDDGLGWHDRISRMYQRAY